MRRALAAGVLFGIIGLLFGLGGFGSSSEGSEGPPRRPCYDCHGQAKADFQKKAFIHAPVKSEDCESCHKRHGFAQKLVLQADYPVRAVRL